MTGFGLLTAAWPTLRATEPFFRRTTTRRMRFPIQKRTFRLGRQVRGASGLLEGVPAPCARAWSDADAGGRIALSWMPQLPWGLYLYLFNDHNHQNLQGIEHPGQL